MRTSLITIFFTSALFLFFGILHIDSFETSDEHFWRDIRIPQYWDALSTADFEQTYINDKPGVSVALVSGIGLATLDTKSDTVAKNVALRLPLVLIHGLLFLPLIFWLLQVLFGAIIARYAIVLIGLSPALVGISQIINPDALLWSTSTIALLAFSVAITRPPSQSAFRYAALAGAMTGFALLSKYTANLLFLFYGLLMLLSVFALTPSQIQAYMRRSLLIFSIVIIVAVFIFSIFLPAVFLNGKILLNGTIFSPPLAPIITPFGLFGLFIFIDTFILRGFFVRAFSHVPQNIYAPVFRFSLVPFFAVIVFVYGQAWITRPSIPFDNVKEIIDLRKGLDFSIFDGAAAPVYFFKEIAVQSLNLAFSLPTLTASLLLFSLGYFICTRRWVNGPHALYIVFIATIPFLFLVGGIIADVFVTVRYSIILQPFFALFVAIGLAQVLRNASDMWHNTILVVMGVLMTCTLWQTMPHPFVYQNSFLPHTRLVTDAWGYGSVEAASYLNSLPGSPSLTIWSDRKGVCYHFVGNCILRNKITTNDLPDYFVITRRNVARKKYFDWVTPESMPYAPENYYSVEILANPFWRHIIHNRPQNYTLIINRLDAEKIIHRINLNK